MLREQRPIPYEIELFFTYHLVFDGWIICFNVYKNIVMSYIN